MFLYSNLVYFFFIIYVKHYPKLSYIKYHKIIPATHEQLTSYMYKSMMLLLPISLSHGRLENKWRSNEITYLGWMPFEPTQPQNTVHCSYGWDIVNNFSTFMVNNNYFTIQSSKSHKTRIRWMILKLP